MNVATACNAYWWMPHNNNEANKEKNVHAKVTSQRWFEHAEKERHPSEKMLKWKYKFSVHPSHLYYSKWEIVYYNSFCCHSCHYWCWWLCFVVAVFDVALQMLKHLSASRWFPISVGFFSTLNHPPLAYRFFYFLAAIFCFPRSQRYVVKCSPFVSCAIPLHHMKKKKKNIRDYLPSHW